MKCKKCNTENILKADYCKGCGNPFTRQEKDAAYKKTIFGVIDSISDLWSKLKLEHITGSKLFKAASFAGLLLYCMLMLSVNGRQLKILDSAAYDVTYAKDSGRYYLVADTSPVGLNLYLPPKTEQVQVTVVDENNYEIHTGTYGRRDSIMLSYMQGYHYVISNEKQSIELFVVLMG